MKKLSNKYMNVHVTKLILFNHCLRDSYIPCQRLCSNLELNKKQSVTKEFCQSRPFFNILASHGANLKKYLLIATLLFLKFSRMLFWSYIHCDNKNEEIFLRGFSDNKPFMEQKLQLWNFVLELCSHDCYGTKNLK